MLLSLKFLQKINIINKYLQEVINKSISEINNERHREANTVGRFQRTYYIKYKEKIEKCHTNFQPSGSKQTTILVLIPGKGPGSRIIFPPHDLIASAVL